MVSPLLFYLITYGKYYIFYFIAYLIIYGAPFAILYPLPFYIISPLYLSFYLDSLYCHLHSSHFLHFRLDCPYSHADFPHPHSHPIPRILILILSISLIPFPSSSFWLLEKACSVYNL